MSFDVVAGCVLVVVSLLTLVVLTFWSRHVIRTIEQRRLKSAREITRELGNGR